MINNKSLSIILIGFTLLCILFFTERRVENETIQIDGIKKVSKVEAQKQRYEYFHKILKDPKTGSIPINIRERELKFAQGIPDKKNRPKKINNIEYGWKEVGPNDVGGRTRALALDKRNHNTVLAGGVSGGLWKSTDNGETWKMKSSQSDVLSITSIAQDLRSGYEDTWYYSAGEYMANSASFKTAAFYGGGLYKSEDNGETWYKLFHSGNSTKKDSYFDLTSKVVVSPRDGSVFVAVNGAGIVRFRENESEPQIVLGKKNEHVWSDVVVSSAGRLIAVISQQGSSINQTTQPGIYISDDNGDTWENITPSTFPRRHLRTVIALAPSNENIVYAYTVKHYGASDNSDISFHKLDLNNNTSEDRSGNLPNFLDQHWAGLIFTFDGYMMTLAVKPDDENFVVLGAVTLYKSADAFATKPQSGEIKKYWIGGNSIRGIPYYRNHHPDQHIIVFDPDEPNKCWSGHDGGLSYTTNIEPPGLNSMVEWQDKNNGYNVTQFYTLALAPNPAQNGIIGGTQDNGTTFFKYINGNTTSSAEIGGGDGGYCYWGEKDVILGINDMIFRGGIKSDGSPTNISNSNDSDWDQITPIVSSKKHFISPFAVDPIDENFVYFLTLTEFWRNNNIREIDGESGSSFNGISTGPTSEHWTNITELKQKNGYELSAIGVSRENNPHIVYIGASGVGKPKILRLDNSKTNQTPSLTNELPVNGAYIISIAVNPKKSDELLVVLSNYNIKSIWHSLDGGGSFKCVDGNLGGNLRNPGPSIRSAQIIQNDGHANYFIGTSTGVYSTNVMDGSNTAWEQEGRDIIGNVVTCWVTARYADNAIGIGTHGRGAFIGINKSPLNIMETDNYPTEFNLSQNYPNPFNPTTTISYQLAISNIVELQVFDMLGREVSTLVKAEQAAGHYSVEYDANGLASGTYLYKLTVGENSKTKKMILVK